MRIRIEYFKNMVQKKGHSRYKEDKNEAAYGTFSYNGHFCNYFVSFCNNICKPNVYSFLFNRKENDVFNLCCTSVQLWSEVSVYLWQDANSTGRGGCCWANRCHRGSGRRSETSTYKFFSGIWIFPPSAILESSPIPLFSVCPLSSFPASFSLAFSFFPRIFFLSFFKYQTPPLCIQFVSSNLLLSIFD